MKVIVAERSGWVEQLELVKRMRQWVLDAEHILDGSWVKPGECVSNEKVGRRFDRWRKMLARCLSDAKLSPVEQECLEQFLQVLSNLRPYLIRCYDRKEFPRTNNELERSIRGRKHAISAHQWAKELEQLSVALWELGGLRGLVGAGCGSSRASGAPRCSLGPRSLA